MDSSYSKNQGSAPHPPLGPVTNLGVLKYGDGTMVKPDIHGIIDKGFFQSDGEWTCYRRNYFSCVCSYSLSPYFHNTLPQYLASGTTQPVQVTAFAMTISAVVADNDGHAIELVQHTPKRDKGPIAKPEKIRLSPRPHQTSHHHPIMYGGHDSAHSATPRPMYSADGYGQPPTQGPYQTEHTFERIQFKQATANNGKRRAAQQYYHLIVELWAELGNQSPEQFVRVAYRKSEKMIVRGRSPGHYQSERRGSTSSGPGGGGSGASISGNYNSSIVGSDSFSTGNMMTGGYGAAYDARTVYQSGRHHAELPDEPMLSADETKAIETPKDYQYYPATIYEDHQDPRPDRVEMFSHHHRGQGGGVGGGSVVSQMGTTAAPYDPVDGKIKSEFDNGMLPPLYHPGPAMAYRRCGQFEGKSSSVGYYPTAMPLSGINVANIH
jgi:meiosis-specific transcription factor NDT80